MVKQFLNLEWKAFIRSASFGKSLGIKVFMGLMALYFLLMFLVLGFALYPVLKDKFPEQEPLLVVNNYLFYWILGDLLFRFFFQKLPVITVKPLLILPIKRRKIINLVLGKSALSFFNVLPLFAIIPFSIMLIVKGGNPFGLVFGWVFALVIVTLIINFINFIIESFSAQTELSFLPVILITSALFALDFFNIISFRNSLGSAFNAMYANPLYITIPLTMLVLVYMLNQSLLLNKLFLDSGVRKKIKEVHTVNLDWTKSFGDVAPFIQLDLRLIWRNKRTKSSVWLLLMGLLYGIIFYPNPSYQNMTFFYIFIGIFSSGIFLINFGQFVPAWDSGYYKLLMSQNIKYEQYLKSKFTLMAVSVIALFILGIPYVYFGWKILIAHFAAAIYNIGVNTHVILLGGSFNRKRIDLNQKAAFNYQGTGAVQWLIGIPLLLVPMALFGILNWLLGFGIACGVLIVMGVLGIVMHEKIMRFITGKYIASKYKMIDAFNQEN